MGIPSGFELFVIIAVVVLLFGGKKIPELAKGLGKGIKDFKNAVKDDDEPTTMTTNEKKIEDESVKTAESNTEAKTTSTETKQA